MGCSVARLSGAMNYGMTGAAKSKLGAGDKLSAGTSLFALVFILHQLRPELLPNFGRSIDAHAHKTGLTGRTGLYRRDADLFGFAMRDDGLFTHVEEHSSAHDAWAPFDAEPVRVREVAREPSSGRRARLSSWFFNAARARVAAACCPSFVFSEGVGILMLPQSAGAQVSQSSKGWRLADDELSLARLCG